METTKKWEVGEAENMFRLYSPKKEIVAEYYYGGDSLRTQDKRQVQFHEIAEKLNNYEALQARNKELEGALKKLLSEYKLSLQKQHSGIKTLRNGQRTNRTEQSTCSGN